MMAALGVQLPEPSSHTPSPGLASMASWVELTTNLVLSTGVGAKTTMNFPVIRGASGAVVEVGLVGGLSVTAVPAVSVGALTDVGGLDVTVRSAVVVVAVLDGPDGGVGVGASPPSQAEIMNPTSNRIDSETYFMALPFNHYCGG